MMMTKILGGALGGALLLSGYLAISKALLVRDLKAAKEVIFNLEGWQGDMVTAIRLASGNPSVNVKSAQGQVQALGQALADAKQALKTSNEAVDRLAEATAKAQAAALRESHARSAAIKATDNLADELARRALSTEEDVDAAVRRIQDDVYGVGL